MIISALQTAGVSVITQNSQTNISCSLICRRNEWILTDIQYQSNTTVHSCVSYLTTVWWTVHLFSLTRFQTSRVCCTSDAACHCFCQFGMKLGSLNSNLAHTTIQQLCHLMSTATDVDSIKRHLIQVCHIVQRLYHGNDEICQVIRDSCETRHIFCIHLLISCEDWQIMTLVIENDFACRIDRNVGIHYLLLPHCLVVQYEGTCHAKIPICFIERFFETA